MIFEIEEIPDGGFNFSLLAAKEKFGVNQPDCSLNSSVRVNGKLTRIERDIFFAGDLQASLQVACTRCLKPYSLNVKNKIQVHFIPRAKEQSPGTEVEVKETDIEQEIYKEGRVDLSGPIRDNILLDVPLIRLCNEGCKGICSECGNDLNTNQCECQKEGEVDPRFAVLKTLKKVEIGRINGSSEEKDIEVQAGNEKVSLGP